MAQRIVDVTQLKYVLWRNCRVCLGVPRRSPLALALAVIGHYLRCDGTHVINSSEGQVGDTSDSADHVTAVARRATALVARPTGRDHPGW